MKITEIKDINDKYNKILLKKTIDDLTKEFIDNIIKLEDNTIIQNYKKINTYNNIIKKRIDKLYPQLNDNSK